MLETARGRRVLDDVLRLEAVQCGRIAEVGTQGSRERRRGGTLIVLSPEGKALPTEYIAVV